MHSFCLSVITVENLYYVCFETQEIKIILKLILLLMLKLKLDVGRLGITLLNTAL